MSGGYFNYEQYKIEDVADSIGDLITRNATRRIDPEVAYSPETIAKFVEAEKTLRQAAYMAHRIDWLVSGDDGEDTFHKRWEEEIKPSETDMGTQPLINTHDLDPEVADCVQKNFGSLIEPERKEP